VHKVAAGWPGLSLRNAGFEQFVVRLQHFSVVPNRILITLFPKLRLYGFWRAKGRFPGLLRILENEGATGLGGWRRALRTGGIGLARQGGHLLRRGWSFLLGVLSLVLLEPSFEHGGGGDEVIVECEERVDVVDSDTLQSRTLRNDSLCPPKDE
jgi:hypothetical protein